MANSSGGTRTPTIPGTRRGTTNEKSCSTTRAGTKLPRRARIPRTQRWARRRATRGTGTPLKDRSYSMIRPCARCAAWWNMPRPYPRRCWTLTATPATCRTPAMRATPQHACATGPYNPNSQDFPGCSLGTRRCTTSWCMPRGAAPIRIFPTI